MAPGYRPVQPEALDLDVLDPAGVGQANSLPVPGGLSVEQMTAGIAAIRARVPLGAAAIASYAPEYDSQQGVCRAAFAALDAILADVACPTHEADGLRHVQGSD
jgi:arginase family enzyme